VAWPKAIPQYDQNYSDLLKTIDEELQKNPNLHLAANYLKGVSLNDCIESAYQNAQNSRIA
jgi:protoporphyrinogen oxidase